MTTRGFTLYQLNALSRLQHTQGHSGIDCNVSDEIDRELGESHNRHPEFYDWHAEYMALVAQPVRESPVCRNCGNVHPVYLGIPDVVRGAMLIRGGSMTVCGICDNRIEYRAGNTVPRTVA